MTARVTTEIGQNKDLKMIFLYFTQKEQGGKVSSWKGVKQGEAREIEK